MSEEDVKTKYITPSIEKAGWNKITQMKFEYTITAGKIEIQGNSAKRGSKLRADYVLFYKENLPIAVVEAKDSNVKDGVGMDQALKYAKKMDLRFAFTSNGKNFHFYDRNLGTETIIKMDEFPSPQELFDKIYKKDFKSYPNLKKVINVPYYFGQDSLIPRYYQQIAINKTVEAIAKGQDRVLLVMATGTGKTYMAFQIIWRLWKSGIKKKILYLADRNILVDQTIIGDFKPFKESMYKVEHKNLDRSYEIYLALYQQLSTKGTEDNLMILKDSFSPNFFDLIIVDECHRGSAKEDSNWRKILDYFECATKIGMTATPKETKEVSNIDYFGEPIYTYSLKDGINDGYLAPFKVIRYAINTDVYGYRPEKGKTDKDGELVEDREYESKDFDRKLVIDERTKLVAEKITEYLKNTDRWAKTIIFCVDIEHAERMRQELTNLNSDLCAIDDRYIMRITGDTEKAQLDNFVDNDKKYPTIVTTSKLLTTGVNCQTCKNIVLDNIFGDNGMTDFKQIIGRGTRINEEYNKMYFTILDFRNATRLFADPHFDGPAIQETDYNPQYYKNEKISKPIDDKIFQDIIDLENKVTENRKIYINNVEVTLLSEKVQYYDHEGKLATENLIDFTKKNLVHDFNSFDEFLKLWSNKSKDEDFTDELEKKGILINELRKQYPNNFDLFDLICDVGYGIKPLTKAERVKQSRVDKILEEYSTKCKEVLKKLLQKYSDNQVDDIRDLTNLKTNDFSNDNFGGPLKIFSLFGGKDAYQKAVKNLWNALYGINF